MFLTCKFSTHKFVALDTLYSATDVFYLSRPNLLKKIIPQHVYKVPFPYMELNLK